VHAYADVDAARDRAFETLYRLYVRDVYRYALAVLRNPTDAEDVTQTTFLNAFRAYKGGEEPLKPQHWLIKIAHNACLTRYQRAGRRPQEVPLEQSAELVAREEAAPQVSELLEALGRLPFNQRAALVMRELEGRSYREIADTLDTSVAAVETLIFRARRALRKDRGALQVLGTVPVPSSLTSFFGGGGAAVSGGAAVGGGAAIGSGLLVKAALLVSAALVVGGVAEKTSDAARRHAVAPVASRALAPMQAAPAGSAGTIGFVVPARAASLPAGAEGALELVGGVLVHTRAATPGARLVVEGSQVTWEPVTVAGQPAVTASASGGAAAAPGTSGPIGATAATVSDVAEAASTPSVLSTVSSGAAPVLGSDPPSMPSATTPSATVPSVTVSSATTPSASVPSVTTPAVTTPPVEVPTVSAPSVTTPSATVPSTPLTPSVTVPSTTVTLPPPPTIP
jgi:RNA polymerase sigma factor (sigma-70 family)